MSNRNDAIVITGAAIVTCLGLTREETWKRVRAGECGMRSFTALETPLPPERLGGQALDLPADFRPEEPREVRYLSWTINDALGDAAIGEQMPYASHRCGIILGTTLHGMRAAGQYLRGDNFDPLRTFLASQTLARACDRIDATGFATTTCSACSSSLGAIALAMTMLRAGELDLVIAGGYDAVSEYVYGGFNSLRLVADGPLRPFARGRQGMKLAEGYGIVILERAADAEKRAAKPLATIVSFGESADAHHLTQPHPTGDGAARAIRAALEAADMNPADIDLIGAHATGTPDTDAGESAAFRNVFGDDLPRVPVVAFKSHLGHTLGAAGAVELILSAMSLRDQIIPPCANSAKEDVEFEGLNLSTGLAKPATIRATLNTSLGFGGANTAAILSVAQAPRPCSEATQDVLITGIGIVAPSAIGIEAFIKQINAKRDPAWLRDTGAIQESDYIHLLNARRVRRMSDYVKLTLAATALALTDANVDPANGLGESWSAILGSTHGSADFSATYYREIVRQGFIGANPVLFAEGVPNAAAAHLSLMLSLKGACQTIIGTRTAGLEALQLAALRIRGGQWDRAIVSAGEEYSPIVNGAYRSCGLYCGPNGSDPVSEKGFTAGAAAVTFVLESRAAAENRGATAWGQILGASAGRGKPGETIDSAARVIESLDRPPAILTSASGTWVDRAEAAAIRRAARNALVSNLYGIVAEHFSAASLLAIAATLATGKLPRMLAPLQDFRAATGDETVDRFASICTDFTGSVSGVAVATGERRASGL
jgi:3-oxoacyl-[acyl-carrier-protein] synthase II